MTKLKSIKDVWNALDKGKTVYWSNTAYRVYVEPNTGSEETKNAPCRLYSERDGMVLSVRCIENYFGSVISESDLSHLFLKQETKHD